MTQYCIATNFVRLTCMLDGRWATAPPSLRVTLWMLLADLPPTAPLLLLATADVPLADLDPEAAGERSNQGQLAYESRQQTRIAAQI